MAGVAGSNPATPTTSRSARLLSPGTAAVRAQPRRLAACASMSFRHVFFSVGTRLEGAEQLHAARLEGQPNRGASRSDPSTLSVIRNRNLAWVPRDSLN